MAKKKYTWYIEPLNAKTNEVISDYQKNVSMDGAATIEPALCGDGKTHNLWECSYKAISMFFKSKQTFQLEFNVFNKQGAGQIRPCPSFLFKKLKKTKTRKKKTAP